MSRTKRAGFLWTSVSGHFSAFAFSSCLNHFPLHCSIAQYRSNFTATCILIQDLQLFKNVLHKSKIARLSQRHLTYRNGWRLMSYPRVGISDSGTGRANDSTAGEDIRLVWLAGPLHTDWARPVLVGMLRVLDQCLTSDEVTAKASVLRQSANALTCCDGCTFGTLFSRQVMPELLIFVDYKT